MRIFIGCSASNNVPIKYINLAGEIADKLSKMDNKLVFGGSERGMMGKCYLSFKFNDKKVKGISDVSYIDELEGLECDASSVANSTFERAKLLYESAQIILFLPGGIGSMSEIFSMLEEKRTRNDNKPIIIYNYDGFYDDLLNMINYFKKFNFVSDNDTKLYEVVTSDDELIEIIKKIEGEI